MIRLIRRSRLLALLLLVATPALGGAWLQAMHPCPVDTPGLQAEHGQHADHEDQAQPTGCHCVGSCAGVSVAAVPAAQLLAAPAVPAPAVRPRVTDDAPAPAVRPADRLPPSTAPPLV